MVEYDVEILGAKNNDSPSEKWVIVKFYTMEYRKCGNSNSKNDSHPYKGASAFLKSVDFRAFEINVKTIAPIQNLYQSGHAIWCERSAASHRLLLDCRKYKVGEKVGEKPKDSKYEDLTENQKLIIKYLRQDPKLSAASLAEKVGISSRKVENNIKKLKEKGLLVRQGSPKKGYWIIV